MKDLIFNYIDQVFFSLSLFILIYRTTIFVKFSKGIPPVIGISLSPRFDVFFKYFILLITIFIILMFFSKLPWLNYPLWIKGIIFFTAIVFGFLTKKDSIQDVGLLGLRIYWKEKYSLPSIFSKVLFVLFLISLFIFANKNPELFRLLNTQR